MMRTYAFILLSALTFACAAQEPADRGAAPPAAEPPSMQAMQGRMSEMRGLMARIHETSDPAERQRLMDEHMRAMGESMQMMGRGMGQQPRAACTEGDTRCEMQRMQGEQQAMQRRMDMMQGMMGQMMEHMMQHGAAPTPADEPTATPGGAATPENHEAHH